jgi:hypothetical protein
MGVRKNSAPAYDPADHVAAAIYHLSAIMDETVALAQELPARGPTTEHNDSGQEPRRVKAFSFCWNNLANSANHNLVGPQQAPFKNATEWLTQSDIDYRELVRKYEGNDEGLTLDRNYGRVARYLRYNESLVESLSALRQIGATLTEKYSGVPFKATSFKRSETAIAAAMSKAEAAANAKLKAEIEANRQLVAA